MLQKVGGSPDKLDQIIGASKDVSVDEFDGMMDSSFHCTMLAKQNLQRSHYGISRRCSCP
jgi:hypothetical protein